MFMRSAILAILFFLSFAVSAEVVTTRGGQLSISGEGGSYDQQLLLNGKLIKKSDAYDIGFFGNYQLEKEDVTIIQEIQGGTACPALYVAVITDRNGFLGMSKAFGNCSDLAQVKQVGQRIDISMPKNSTKKVVFSYKGGSIYEGTKLIERISLRRAKSQESGQVFINGRGQVLVSGEPNKKMLQCVENLVEKERAYKDGWEDVVLKKCGAK